MKSTTAKEANLLHDEQGAIMIMGLAMILGLIAFMWYLLGIGETVAFRDHMQDAADAAAFSQSAVNAVGMNLIVLINMIIMVIVAIYLVYSFVITAQWVSMVACCADIWGCTETACIPDAISYYNDWKTRNNFAKNVLSNADRILSYLESGIALAAPWAGSFAGYDAASDTKTSMMDEKPVGFAFSGTNIPEMGALNLKKMGPRYGLPVTHERLGNVCAHLVDALGGLIGGRIGGGIINKVTGVLGEGVRWYYCDNTLVPDGLVPGGLAGKGLRFIAKLAGGAAASIERLMIGGGDGASYWNDEGYGPMKNWAHKDVTGLLDALKTDERHKAEEKNGADRWQSYGFVVLPKYGDHHATHNIKFMQLNKPGWASGADVKPAPYGYFANAELYYDCKDAWTSDECDNLIGADRMDMTMYRFEWRARLVKFHVPTKLGGEIFNVIQNGLDMFSSVKSAINGAGADKFVSIISKVDQFLGTNILGTIGNFADAFPAEIYH